MAKDHRPAGGRSEDFTTEADAPTLAAEGVLGVIDPTDGATMTDVAAIATLGLAADGVVSDDRSILERLTIA